MSSPTGAKRGKCETNDDVASPPDLNLTIPTRRDIGKKHYEWSSNEIQSQLPTDIVLITVKDHEFNSCYSYMKRRQVQRSWCDGVGMVDFGKFGEGDVRVALIRSEGGPVPALLVVKNAAEILYPKVVLFVGCCATVNPAEAKLGDVIISAKLATYSSTRITEDGTRELRGVKVHVSKNIAKLILSAGDGWMPPIKNEEKGEFTVHGKAVFLSGPEEVRNRARCEELLKSVPEALGLEMEG